MRKTVLTLAVASAAVLAPGVASATVEPECEGPRMEVVNGVCKYVPPPPRECDENAIRNLLWFWWGC